MTPKSVGGVPYREYINRKHAEYRRKNREHYIQYNRAYYRRKLSVSARKKNNEAK